MYRRKRDFYKTPEPAGTGKAPGKHAKQGTAPTHRHLPVFVVQMHDATRLHYDFRLEAEGLLKSWAIPKGPSMDPKDKHLAVATEDHPLEYAAFEGVIPEGNYGAGAVMVWDGGVYENLTRDKSGREIAMEEAVRQGHLKVLLHGKKLQGAFALTRTSTSRGKENWIIVKMRDQFASSRAGSKDRDRSILTNRTLEDIANEQSPEEVAVQLS